MTDEPNGEAAEMRTERIKMQDGRYLIYYTFSGLDSEADREQKGTGTPVSEDVDADK